PEQAQGGRYWDMASTDRAKRKGKDKREPEWSVVRKLAHHQGLYWIEDIVRVQMTPAEVEDIIRATADIDGYNCAIRMEQEPGSSGDITIDHYARNVLNGYDFQGVRSTGSKVERARPVSSAMQQGRIFITDRCRNKQALFDELDVFPYGMKDDIVRELAGAFVYFRKPVVLAAPTGLRKGGGSYWRRPSVGGDYYNG